jgi:hypothetical protein
LNHGIYFPESVVNISIGGKNSKKPKQRRATGPEFHPAL